MEKRYKNIDTYELITSLVFLLGGIILFFYIIPNQITGGDEIPNARTFPYIFSILLIYLSFVWAIMALRKSAEHSGERIIKGIGVGSLLLLLAFLLEVGGFFLTGIVTVSTVALMINWKKWIPVLIFSVCVTAVYYVFFWKLLHIAFPTGWLFV